jgi:NAD(P)-dependent dehydrogenase (short-subunit alcohol dehydrogenase family)
MSLPRPRHLVTGATSGVGRATARILADSGASVLVHARTREKGEPVVEELRRETGSDALTLVTGDFEELDQVRDLARRVSEEAPELDVLVNNAGVILDRRFVTEDGFEETFQVNHLAPFLLTLLLLDPLRRALGRVVTVSSGAHAGSDLGPEGLEARMRGEGGFRGMTAYADSKMANILFTRELARREAEAGIDAYAVHPGVLATGIWNRGQGVLHGMVRLFSRFFGDPASGGEVVARLALDPPDEAPSGSYFHADRLAEPRLRSDPEATARALWEESRRAVGLDG